MKAITKTWNNLTEFLKAKPWLFLALIPIFYVTLPAISNRHSFVIREFNKLAPSEIRAEFSQFELEIDKLTRSLALCAMIIAISYVLGSLRPSLFED
jgi:hypothetical protein